jgi:membrane-associated protease RseP (regulator of RpoE activity)
VIELVAITHAAAPPPPARLRAIPVGGLMAVVGPANDEEATAESLWRHEELVEELMADCDVLPVRYGTRFADDDDAAHAIAARHATLAAALDHVRGAVELSVRAIGAEPRAVHAALSELARDAVERTPHPPEVLRAAYLIDRDAVEAFAARVAQLETTQRGAQILCTGPWPPYSFSERS